MSKLLKDIPVEVLRAFLDYNPETGELVWRPRGGHLTPDRHRNRFNSQFAG